MLSQGSVITSFRNLIKKSFALSVAIAVFCTLLWGSAFPCIKIGYELFRINSDDIPSKLLFAGARFAFAGLIVILTGFIFERKSMVFHKKDALPISVLALFQTYMQYFLLYIGLGHITGTKSALLTSVSAFGSVILSSVFFKNDKLSSRKVFGCIIGVCGIIFMNLTGDSMLGFTLKGDGIVILSNLSGAAGNVISKKIAAYCSPVKTSGYQLIIGGICLILTGVLTGGNLYFYDSNCVFILLYLSAMAGIALMLWTILLSVHPVSRIAAFNLLIPVFGAMWSGLFLGENILTPENLISLTLVCAGIFAVNTAGSIKNNNTIDNKNTENKNTDNKSVDKKSEA